MPRNLIWTLLLSLIVGMSVIYSAYAFYSLWQFARLDQTVPAKNLQWSVKVSNETDFYPLATYFYEVTEKHYEGETQFKENYLNAWSAQEAIQRLSQSPLPVWYDRSHPEISTLQKKFPWKELLYTVLLWGITIYFIFLGLYVSKKLSNR